jgi:hypothetical protein
MEKENSHAAGILRKEAGKIHDEIHKAQMARDIHIPRLVDAMASLRDAYDAAAEPGAFRRDCLNENRELNEELRLREKGC